MATSGVRCQDCDATSEAIEWGFVLIARHGWTAQLMEAGQDPFWRCPPCSEREEAAAELGFEVDDTPVIARRYRVLLVDDQDLVLRATALMLREFDVITAASGQEGLELLARGGHFDVVVSDVSMPDMTGPRFFVEVARRFRPLAYRFLFLSGDVYRALPGIGASAAEVHVEPMPALLEKPVPRDALVREIRELGDRRHLPRSGTFAVARDVLGATRAVK